MVKSLLNSKYFLLVVFWVFLTAFNVTKAFHIDDTFHLLAAQHLQQHPTAPMSGLINWSDKKDFDFQAAEFAALRQENRDSEYNCQARANLGLNCQLAKRSK